MTGLAIWMPHLEKLRSCVIVINYYQGFVSPEAASSTPYMFWAFFLPFLILPVYKIVVLSDLKCAWRAIGVIDVTLSGGGVTSKSYTMYTVHTCTCLWLKKTGNIFYVVYLYISVFILPPPPPPSLSISVIKLRSQHHNLALLKIIFKGFWLGHADVEDFIALLVFVLCFLPSSFASLILSEFGEHHYLSFSNQTPTNTLALFLKGGIATSCPIWLMACGGWFYLHVFMTFIGCVRCGPA